ncbi:MAG: M3 family metallopeptidase, partial [Myxococcales bacterium]|nr:M3 family metallopeptidase [Myxococcales bacterium]
MTTTTTTTPDHADANPLLAWGTLPAFDAIEVAHVAPALERTLAWSRDELADIEAHAASLPAEALVARLERLEDRLGWTWGLVNHLNSVRTSDPLRQAIEAAQPDVVTFQSRLAQSRPVYLALKAATEAPGFDALPPAVQRVATLNVRGAEHSGVGLEGEALERFNANRQELARLSLAFGNHVLDATKAFGLTLRDKADVAGLPASLLGLASAAARAAGEADATPADGPWRVTLDYPSFVPFMEHSERRDLREQLYRAHVTRASAPPYDNGPLVERILELRADQAKILGFPSFAALSIDAKMAPEIEAVHALLEDLRAASYPAAVAELDELRAFAREAGEEAPLELWDMSYWARRLREARFAYSDEALRPYFPLPAVLDGLFGLATRIFGVTVEASDDVPAWHDDVRSFLVRGEDGAPVARFYLDPYSRPADKRGGAWMNECVGRSALLAGPGEAARNPVAYLVCNQSPPIDGAPSLMTFNEVSTLFHEFGHGLQHMLTRVDHG